jgi:ankyrin repeat protein
MEQAIRKGQINKVRQLLDGGADIGKRIRDGETYLHVAIANRRDNIARLLLERGADINARDSGNETPLAFAVDTIDPDIDFIAFLLRRGANVNVQNIWNQTPLLKAAVRGHDEIIRRLIEAGAEVNIQDADGNSPLHAVVQREVETVENGFERSTRILLENGADPNAKNKSGITPIHSAAFGGLVPVVRLLLEKGVDVNAKSDENITPLHFAVERGNEETVRLLLERGADPNAKDNEGNTPLFGPELPPDDWNQRTRRSYNNGSITRILLEHGANPMVKNNEGWTPIDYAEEYQQLEVKKVLEEGAAPFRQREIARAAGQALAARPVQELAAGLAGVAPAVGEPRYLPPGIPERIGRFMAPPPVRRAPPAAPPAAPPRAPPAAPVVDAAWPVGAGAGPAPPAAPPAARPAQAIDQKATVIRLTKMARELNDDLNRYFEDPNEDMIRAIKVKFQSLLADEGFQNLYIYLEFEASTQGIAEKEDSEFAESLSVAVERYLQPRLGMLARNLKIRKEELQGGKRKTRRAKKRRLTRRR